jgi:hypothetical protein
MSSVKSLYLIYGLRCALRTSFAALLVISFAQFSAAAETCVGVAIPNSSSKTGVSISLPVSVTEMNGLGAKSSDFTVTYNDASLTFLGATTGAVGSSNGAGRILTVNAATPGTVTISLFGSTEFQGAGTLVNLNFNVIGSLATTSAVSFSSFTFNEGTPCDATTNGSVSIVSGAISGKITYGNALGNPTPPRAVPGVSLNASGSISRSIVTGNDGGYSLGSMGAGAYTVTPSKTGDLQGAISGLDASDIAVHAVGGSPQLTGNRAVVADVSGNGTITSFDAAMIATYTVGLVDETGSTGTWRFLPVPRSYTNVNVDYGDQDYVALLMGDVTGNWDHPSGVPNLAISSVEDPLALAVARVGAASGTTLAVPVTVGETTGRGIRAYEFNLYYDADVLEPALTAASVAGTISDGRVLTVNATQKGVLRIVTFGAYPLEGTGELLKLNFNVIGPAGSISELRWGNVRLNEGGVNFTANNGEVNVAASAGSGSINGRLLDPKGNGVARSRVTVTDTEGNRRTVLTSTLGYFQVSELKVGGTYTVQAESRRYRFAAQSVSITNGNAVELQMIGLE